MMIVTEGNAHLFPTNDGCKAVEYRQNTESRVIANIKNSPLRGAKKYLISLIQQLTDREIRNKIRYVNEKFM